MPSDAELVAELDSMSNMLAKRATESRLLDTYYEGTAQPPKAIQIAGVTRAYQALMPVSDAPWGSLVVDSVQDRLEVAGIRSADSSVDDVVWGHWQDNGMDAESKLAQNASLISGRSFALVWPDADGKPQITLDNSEQMIVKYAAGSRRVRLAAYREWEEDGVRYGTLYRPDGVYKFKESKSPNSEGKGERAEWVRREVDGEEWPLANPLNIVPVVELTVNRRLKPGSYGFARGEFAHCLGLIDRINLLTFLGLVVAFWMGFPLRGVIGEKILKDDNGNAIAPFDANAGGLAMLENKDASIFEYKAADRKNLSIYSELDQLATITKTPRHYLPMESGMSNLSADAIRASEGGLHAKVPSHKASLGEGWEEVLRLCGLMDDTPVELSPRAELLWKDHESRSVAERADAATKVASLNIPWEIIAEKYLSWTQDEIARGQAQVAAGAFETLITEANQPAPELEVV